MTQDLTTVGQSVTANLSCGNTTKTHQNHLRALSNAMDTQVVVALVGGGFAVLVALISKIGHDNKKDHGIVHQSLGRIEQKIDGHVENHR
jgi:hypothetical protein